MQRTCYATDFFLCTRGPLFLLFCPFLVSTSSGHSRLDLLLMTWFPTFFLPIMVHVRDGYSCASGFLGSFAGLLFSDTPFGCIEPGVRWFLIFFSFWVCFHFRSLLVDDGLMSATTSRW